MDQILSICPKCQLRRLVCEATLKEKKSGKTETVLAGPAKCAGCGWEFQAEESFTLRPKK